MKIHRQAIAAILLACCDGASQLEALPQAPQQPETTPQSRELEATVGLDYLAQPIINPLGGLEQSSSLLQGLWLQVKLGSGLKIPTAVWQEIDHWSVATRVSIVRGNSTYYQQLGAAYPLQTMTSSGQWLTEASIRREAGKSKFALQAGILTLNPDFMDVEIFNYYIHSAINDTFNEEVIGIPIAPLASPGLMIAYGDSRESNIGLFKVGFFQIVSNNQFGVSLNQSSPTASLSGGVALLQWEKQLSMQKLNKQVQASKVSGIADELPAPNLMLGGYWSQSTATINGQSNPLASVAQGLNRTLYASMTLPLTQSKDGLSKGRLWVAGRLGLDWNNNPAPYFAGLGIIRQGLIAGRPSDVSGLGIVTTGFSPTISPGLSQESVIELNHRIRISPRLGLKPFVQLILNPGGSGQIAPILATGLQFSASL